MSCSKENLNKVRILIVGSGIIGKFNALELSKQGFKVTIVDNEESKNSSNAALGILMGHIYQKRHGRSWELRKVSINLWPKWINYLGHINSKLQIEKPLLQLTKSRIKFEKLKQFARNNLKEKFEIIEKNSPKLKKIHEIFESNDFQGLISYEDGRINPRLLLDTIDLSLKKNHVNFVKGRVIKIEKKQKKWIGTLENEKELIGDIIILCNSLNSLELLKEFKHKIKLKPILGQAIEILYDDDQIDFLSLPKNFNIDGKNFIPLTKNKIILGSTDENSLIPEEAKINELTEFLDNNPKWMNKKNIIRKWFGIRSRPDGEPSPILKTLDKGLIICSGFYKNGILLAPGSADWISKEIKKHL